MAVSVERTQPRSAAVPLAIEDVEIQLLLDGLARVTGFDFREYDPAVIKRRIERAMALEGLGTVSALQDKVFHDAESLDRVLSALTVARMRMFSNPDAFTALRSLVVPLLRTYPFLRIWQMGCGTSEETYAIAIFLAETGLYDRCKVYATDALESVINRSRTGSYAVEAFDEWSQQYLLAGGCRALGDYIAERRDGVVVIDPALRKNIVFARHSLVSDASFNEFHVIFCSQVLSQFNLSLRSRVQRLIHDSLVRLGFVVLGKGESMQGSPFEQHYRLVDEQGGVYRRIS